MLNKKILVKSITSLSEARYCAGMFVDYISFDFTETSEYFIAQKQFQEIRGWVSGVAILGSLETDNASDISKTIEENQLDGFIFSEEQLHLMALVDSPIKVLEWEDLSILPNDLDENIILILKKKDQVSSTLPQNQTLLGYDFENVSIDKVDGYAFIGSFETQVGINSYTQLMESLEYIDENY